MVKQWLVEDEQAPRKQRHTAHRVYTRLKTMCEESGETLGISERTVRTLVAQLRKEIAHSEPVRLPLVHPMGEAQVDFGTTQFLEKGVTYEGYHLAVTFPYSDAKFVQLFKGENFECLARGLADIFAFIGKAPTVIRFDNMSTAVKAIKKDGAHEITDSFRRLQMHYGFESNFCNAASGHEKGSVENFAGTGRRNYFVPVPQIDDPEAYNRELLVQCRNDLTRRHYQKEENVAELFAPETQHMAGLPAEPFEAFRYVEAKNQCPGNIPFSEQPLFHSR